MTTIHERRRDLGVEIMCHVERHRKGHTGNHNDFGSVDLRIAIWMRRAPWVPDEDVVLLDGFMEQIESISSRGQHGHDEGMSQQATSKTFAHRKTVKPQRQEHETASIIHPKELTPKPGIIIVYRRYHCAQ